MLGGDEDGGFASKAIKVNEQLKAATGVDLVQVAGRFGSSSGGGKKKGPPAPPKK
jgi:hypothetical protein